MTINQKTLGELCARVAAGDEQARRDFDRHVPPLVEIVVSRWLSRQRHETREIGRARQITRTICARMISQFADASRPRAWPLAETIYARGQWDTVSQPIG